MTNTKSLLLATALCTFAIGHHQMVQANDNNISGYVAVGGIYTSEYEGSEDYEVSPFAAARVQFGDHYYIETEGPGLRANVSTHDHIEFGPALNYRGGRDDDVDNDAVSRLREIDDAFEAGAFAKIKTNGVRHASDELAFEIDVLTDISGEHEGTLVSFGPSYSYSPTERLRLGVSASATYATDDYAETYFSVNARNVGTSGLANFDADGGFKDIGVGVSANYALNDRWGLVGIAGYNRLLGDFADSPIVDDEGDAGQMMLGAGLTYRF